MLCVAAQGPGDDEETAQGASSQGCKERPGTARNGLQLRQLLSLPGALRQGGELALQEIRNTIELICGRRELRREHAANNERSATVLLHAQISGLPRS
jgi:hypothetical protein